MAQKELVLALGLVLASAPVSASNPELMQGAAPPGTEQTRYCMRIEANTGSRIETIRCWTRAEWAEQGVDVDKDWDEEGVRVIT